MDKKEYKICADEIQRLIKRKRYAEAAKIADTIDWRNVQNISMLCTISDLYKVNRRPEDARGVLLLAYDKHPQGRMIVYALCELSLLCEDVVSARQYYNEFVNIAPRDNGKFILEYKLFVALGVSLEEQIAVLQELKKRDYSEKWGYELAYLYHRVGLATECVQECDELFVWFQEGKYVTKALELKMLHEPLSETQQRHYKGNKRPSVNTIVQGMSEDDINIEVKPVNVGEYATINLQRELAENLQPYIEQGMEVVGEPQPAVDTEEVNLNPQITGQIDNGYAYEEEAGEFTREILSNLMNGDSEVPDMVEVAPGMVSMNTGYVDEYGQPIYTEPIPAEQLGMIDGLYNDATYGEPVVEEFNLQPTAPIDPTPMEPIPLEAESMLTEDMELYPLKDYATEPVPASPAAKEEERVKEKAAKLAPMAAPKVVKMSSTGKMPKIHQTDKLVPIGIKAPTAVQMAKESAGKEFDEVLTQEADGQISLVMPSSPMVERQITGQMDIETMMKEWNAQWENAKKNRSDAQKEKLKRTTDNLFAEFDEATKDDFLNRLEQMAEKAIAKEKKRSISPSQAQERLAAEARRQKEEMEAVQKAEEEAAQKAKEAAEILARMEAKEKAEAAFQEVLRKEKKEADLSEFESDEVENIVVAEEPAEEKESEEKTAEIKAESTETIEEKAEDEGKEKEIAKVEEETEDKESTDTVKELDENDKAEEEVAADKKIEEAKTPKEIRAMTADEKRLFGSFIQTKATKDQIVNCIDSMSLASYTGNVIVTGDRGMGSGKLAKTLLKEMHMSDANFSNKVAKMTGLSMNGKNMEELLDKLSNGALLIEKAGNMRENAVRNLLKALNSEKRGVVVILEDTKIAVNKLINSNVELEKFFNIRVDIEALDNDALVSYAKKYAESREHSIDELGVLALYERIAESQTSDHAVTTRDVQDMVEDSIRQANRKTIPHFVDTLLGKRYDDEDMVIIREKDIAAY